MKLIHLDTLDIARIGDVVTTSKGAKGTISHFVPPHKPSSSGHISVKAFKNEITMDSYNYVGVWGLEWIDREDRPHQKACDWHEKDTDCEKCP